MKYIVTEEIESPVRVAKHIEFFDLLFVVCYMAVSFAFSVMVAEKLKTAFLIFSAVVAIILTSKSPFNQRRRNIESIFFMLKKDNEVYRPVYDEEAEDEQR